MAKTKKPSLLTDKLVARKDPHKPVKTFSNTEEGVRSFIQTRTAYDSRGIESVAREELGFIKDDEVLYRFERHDDLKKETGEEK